MSTNLSASSVDPHAKKLTNTHQGEHHGDFSDISLKVTRATVIFSLCAALNSCNLGYDIGVSTNAGSLIQRDLGLTDIQREIFVGSLNFWSIFGSLFSHWICDAYGRRKSFQVAALAFILGLVIMACANGFAVLMVGRLFVGLGVGFGLAVSVDLVVSSNCEVSPKSVVNDRYPTFNHPD
jgi:MFS family permease